MITLAQAAPDTAPPAIVHDGKAMLATASDWVAEHGLSFAASLATAIIIYIVGAWLAGLIRKGVVNSLNRRGTDQTVVTYIANIIHGLILVLVIVTALGQLGIPTAQFAALIAAAGLAIGLALQGNLSNFASGFLLVFFRPFQRGDYLSAGGTEGTVEEIGIFTTTLNTLDNKKVVVPNSAITGGNITNFSANPKRVVIVPCTVAGTNAPEKVRATLLGAAAGNAHVLADPAPVAVLANLGENKYTMELRAWCDPTNFWPAQFTLNEAAKKALDDAGISAPLPAMRIVQS
jgi:small conductance mechanosensitive channel